MKYFVLWSLFFLVTSQTQAKLLDKISAVINERIVTLSEVREIQKTLPIRSRISPTVYPSAKMNQKKVIDLVFDNYIIRDKLKELGYIITDDAVENRIKMTEQRLNSKRSELITFLKNNGLSFEEYFEIMRESIERGLFQSKIISPLVSITEQEIKNQFYKKYSGKKRLSFTYTLVDFNLPQNKVQPGDINQLPGIFQDYQKTGNIPEIYKDFETVPIEGISESSLDKSLVKLLRNTDEGRFSDPVLRDGAYHLFYVKKKNLKESNNFQKQKEMIKNQLFLENSNKITDNWLENERSNYFIQNNL